MHSDRLSSRQRYAAAGASAALVTALLLFVMTQLITPIGGDPAVERMLLELEIFRLPPDAPTGISDPEPTADAASESPETETALPSRPERAEDDGGIDEPETEPEQEPKPSSGVDWWSQAQNVARSMGNEELEALLQSPGFEDWVSVMQGPMPSTGDVARAIEEDAVWSFYWNVYGDIEIRVSKDCVLQIQSRPFDYSSFAKNIPPNILCKETPVIDVSGLEDYVNGGRGQ